MVMEGCSGDGGVHVLGGGSKVCTVHLPLHQPTLISTCPIHSDFRLGFCVS